MERDFYSTRLDTRIRLSPPSTPLRSVSRDASLRLRRSPLKQSRSFEEPGPQLASVLDDDNLSTSQKDLAIRVADASDKIHRWHDELERWKWTGSFDKNPSSIDLSLREGHAEHRLGSMEDDEILHRFGSLSLANVTQYEANLDNIHEEFPLLNLDELKERILDIHQTNSRPSSRSSMLTVSNLVFLDDFSFFVTRTLIRSLPASTALRRQLKTWTSRLYVFRHIPHFLRRHDVAAYETTMAWQELDPKRPITYDDLYIVQEQSRLDRIKTRLQSDISEAATSLDAMLDQLEEQEDVLPDQWIDSFEKVEADFAEWCCAAQQRVFNLRIGLLPDIDEQQGSKPTLEHENTIPRVSLEQQNRHLGSDGARDTGEKCPGDSDHDSLEIHSKAHQASPSTPRQSRDEAAEPLGLNSSQGQWSMNDEEDIASSTPSFAESVPRISLLKPEMERLLQPSGDTKDTQTHLAVSSMPLQVAKEEQHPGYIHSNIEPKHDNELTNAIEALPANITIEEYKDDKSEGETSSSASNISDLHSNRASSSFSPHGNSVITESSFNSELAEVSSAGFTTELTAEDQARSVTPDLGYEDDIPSFLDDISRLSIQSEAGADDVDSDPGDSPLQHKGPVAKMPRPPLNAIMKKRSSRGSKLRLTTFKDDDALLSSSPSRTPNSQSNDSNYLSPVSPVMPLEQQLSDILDAIPTPIRLRTGPKPNAPEVKRTRLRTFSNHSRRPTIPSRSATPALILAPADETSRRHTGNGPDIRLYHLIQTGQDKPIKLFIRRVGENGERVMVRVGGGWADLAEYLRIYAEHHGRRTISDGRIELQALTADKNALNTPPQASSTRRASLLNSASRSGTPTGDSGHDVDSIAGTPGFATETPQSVASASSRRSLGWDEVGLAGPKTRRAEMSDEKKDWVDGIVEQAKKGLGKNVEVGDIGKSGGTRRIYFRAPSGASGRKTPAPE